MQSQFSSAFFQHDEYCNFVKLFSPHTQVLNVISSMAISTKYIISSYWSSLYISLCRYSIGLSRLFLRWTLWFFGSSCLLKHIYGDIWACRVGPKQDIMTSLIYFIWPDPICLFTTPTLNAWDNVGQLGIKVYFV